MPAVFVPDVRQVSDSSCGDAAVSAYLGALGLARRRGTNLSNPVQGLSPDTLAAVLRAHGLTVRSAPLVAGVDELRLFVRCGLPVLCPISERGGHWIVVNNVTPKRVHFHCPVAGPDSRTVAEWLAVWQDETVEGGHRYDRWGIVATLPTWRF